MLAIPRPTLNSATNIAIILCIPLQYFRNNKSTCCHNGWNLKYWLEKSVIYFYHLITLPCDIILSLSKVLYHYITKTVKLGDEEIEQPGG